MAKLFYTDIDLKGNQLLNPVLHKLQNAPSTPQEGQLYYSSETKLTYQCIGYNDNVPVWIPVTGSVADLTANANKVVTGVTSNRGVATLGTTGVQDLVLGVALPKAVKGTAMQSLQQVMEAVDEAIDNRVVRESLWTSEGRILVTSGTKAAMQSVYSLQGTTMHGDSNYEIPTSHAIAQYVAGLAGGLNYKGTVDATRTGEDTDTERRDLPTIAVNGDIWVVKTNGAYTVNPPSGTENASHGDLFVASVAGGVITWGHIPLEFDVNSADISKLAPADGLQTIATIDGTPVKLGIQAITVDPTATGAAMGNVVDGISFDGNNVATLSKKNVVDKVSVTGAPGIVTNVSLNADGQTIDVLQQSIAVSEPSNLQYVKGLSQAANGQVTITAGQFDQTIDATTGGNVDVAPSTKAVKGYVDGKIGDLDVTGLNIVTKDTATGMLYLQTVVKETDGKIELVDGSAPFALQKVASTGQAVDVKVPVNSGISETETNVLEGLQGLQSALNNLGDHVVNSIQGIYGEITIGEGLDTDTSNDNKILKAKIKSGDYVTVTAADGIHLDPGKIDSGYDSADSNLATVESIQHAIAGVNVSEAAIGDNSSAGAITIKGIYQDGGSIGLQSAGNTVIVWNLDGSYNASTNKIALQSTVTNAINDLDGSATVMSAGTYTPQTGEIAGYKVDIFGVVEENGVVSAAQNPDGSLYVTEAPTAANPIVTHNDINSMLDESIDAHYVENPQLTASGGVCTWNIVVGNMSQAEQSTWHRNTVVEVRDVNNYVVDTDVMYDVANQKIVIKVNGQGYDALYFNAVVLTKHKYTVLNQQ